MAESKNQDDLMAKIRAELKQKNLLNYVVVSQIEGDTGVGINILNNPESRKHFPALFTLLDQAHQDANNSSLRDANIPRVGAVYIGNTIGPQFNHNAEISQTNLTSETANSITVTRVELSQKFFGNPYDEALATLSHEIYHNSPDHQRGMFLAVQETYADMRTLDVLKRAGQFVEAGYGQKRLIQEGKPYDHDVVDLYNKGQRVNEADADWAAHNPISQVKNFVRYLKDHPSVYDYSTNDPNADHFNDKIRIQHPLIRAYLGTDLAMKPELDGDVDVYMRSMYQEEKAGKPHFTIARRLETGEMITNFSNEIRPAAANKIAENMQYIESMILNADGAVDPNQITDENIQAIGTYLEQQVAEFHQQHPRKLVAPDNAYIAAQFEESLQDPRIRDAVLKMHPEMPNAYAAIERIDQMSDHFESKEIRDTVADSAKQHLIDNIKQGIYPTQDVKFVVNEALKDLNPQQSNER